MRNKDFQTLYMDFEGLRSKGINASDIDMFYICENGFLILGEIKNEHGYFANYQRSLYEQIIDNHKQGGAVLFIKHNKYQQNGDESVDVSNCPVVECYYNGRWQTPKEYTSVTNAIYQLRAMQEQKI